MITQRIHSISILGAGNVAYHLAHWFSAKGYLIEAVWNRTNECSESLAASVGSKAVRDIRDLPSTSDLYLLCLSDDALPELIRKISGLGLSDKIVAHTSGSSPISLFAEAFRNYGAFYPLQTFSKGKQMNVEDVPFFITANNEKTTEKLGFLAMDMSGKCYPITDDQRAMIHLSAVFACNFTNHLFCISQKLMEENRLSFELLQPLISETVQKALEQNPCTVQTGPAIRNDLNIINKHLSMLDSREDLKKIYELLSSSIRKRS